jgi:hypothetical protein
MRIIDTPLIFHGVRIVRLPLHAPRWCGRRCLHIPQPLFRPTLRIRRLANTPVPRPRSGLRRRLPASAAIPN